MMVVCLCNWNGQGDFVLLNYNVLTTCLGWGEDGVLLGEQNGGEGRKGGIDCVLVVHA